MCKYYLYCRVSTDDKGQEFRRQMLIAENSGLQFEEVFQEHISGGVRGDKRKEFNRMLEMLDEDSCVVVSESSRFGRNYLDCLDMIDIITQDKGASIKFLSNGLELKGKGKPSPYEWLVMSQFFIMDEFQKRQIGYNTRMALQAKKNAGVVLGHPKSEIDPAKVQQIKTLFGTCSVAEIQRRVGLGRRVVDRVIREECINGL